MKLSIKTMLMILIIPASINAEEISYDYIDLKMFKQEDPKESSKSPEIFSLSNISLVEVY